MLVLAKQTRNNFQYKVILTWSSDFFALIGIEFSTYRENILRVIKSRLISLSCSRQKKLQHQSEKINAERKNVTFRFDRCQSTPPIMWIYFLQVLSFGIFASCYFLTFSGVTWNNCSCRFFRYSIV